MNTTSKKASPKKVNLFLVGSVVELKSGGPPMTVAGLGEDGDAICIWIGDSSECSHRDEFPLACLKPYDIDG